MTFLPLHDSSQGSDQYGCRAVDLIIGPAARWLPPEVRPSESSSSWVLNTEPIMRSPESHLVCFLQLQWFPSYFGCQLWRPSHLANDWENSAIPAFFAFPGQKTNPNVTGQEKLCLAPTKCLHGHKSGLLSHQLKYRSSTAVIYEPMVTFTDSPMDQILQ